jgi:hypothetical protein
MENIFETLGGILQPDKNNTMDTKHTKGEWLMTNDVMQAESIMIDAINKATNE